MRCIGLCPAASALKFSFGIHWHSYRYAEAWLNVLVWIAIFFYSSMYFLTFFSRPQILLYINEKWIWISNNNSIKQRYLFFLYEELFTVSMIWDNFMCHFCLKKIVEKISYTHPVHPYIGNVEYSPFMFVYYIYVFFACSFTWSLTARVHLSIKNIVDKHKCLDENNEYGLPIMILWACTLTKRSRIKMFLCRRGAYMILWRWIETQTHIHKHMHTMGNKLHDAKKKSFYVLCKQKEKCKINVVNSTSCAILGSNQKILISIIWHLTYKKQWEFLLLTYLRTCPTFCCITLPYSFSPAWMSMVCIPATIFFLQINLQKCWFKHYRSDSVLYILYSFPVTTLFLHFDYAQPAFFHYALFLIIFSCLSLYPFRQAHIHLIWTHILCTVICQ